jgi:SAM-dependent methyltransferase
VAEENKISDYAESFEKYRSGPTEGTAALMASVLRSVPSSSAARMIDIGCGTGRYTLPLASGSKGRVFATDLSWDMVIKGRQKDTGEQVFWLLADACRMPFMRGSFDAALLFLVLHLVKDPRQAVKEAYRVLCPGGHCFILAHSYSQLDRQTVFRWFPEARKLNKRRMLSLTKLKEMVRETGFGQLRTEEITESTVYARDVFLEKIRSKPNTSLRSISEADFNRRYQALEAAVGGRGQRVGENFSTLLTALKEV